MDANTNPRDVICVELWTTRSEIQKKLWEAYHWTASDIAKEPGLLRVVLFLTRDMGLEGYLKDFHALVSENALALFNRVTWLGKEYAEASRLSRRAYEAANGLNGEYQSLYNALELYCQAIEHAGREAIAAVIGDSFGQISLAQAQERVLAEALIDNLRAEGLI